MSLKTFPYNALNFSDDFNRGSEYFNATAQRRKGLISIPSSGYLSFEFKPDTMPGSAPTCTMTLVSSSGTNSRNHTAVIEFSDRYIYFFSITGITANSEIIARIAVAGYSDVIYSELFECVAATNLQALNIATLIAYNSEDTRGYFGSTHPICGFFEVSKLNVNVFGNEKTEYSYSYGRKKILSSENFIKKRLTFHNLTMYRQNLLKWLCNCQTLTIDGVNYCIVSDFTEKNKDENSEICDLQADFIEVDGAMTLTGAAATPSPIKSNNLFIK